MHQLPLPKAAAALQERAIAPMRWAAVADSLIVPLLWSGGAKIAKAFEAGGRTKDLR